MLKIIANSLIFISLVILLLIFWPILKVEIKYSLDRISSVKYSLGTEQFTTFERPLVPANREFSIVIPKIAAVAPIISGVDSQDPRIYLPALKQGVAHALGTSYPGEEGNTYLFAHSTDAFYNVNQYNAIFYLIGKLEYGDEIDVFYQGVLYKYEVVKKKVVNPKDVEYLGKTGEGETLTLQTCYPPGTAVKRLVVIARRKGD